MKKILIDEFIKEDDLYSVLFFSKDKKQGLTSFLQASFKRFLLSGYLNLKWRQNGDFTVDNIVKDIVDKFVKEEVNLNDSEEDILYCVKYGKEYLPDYLSEIDIKLWNKALIK